MIKGRSLNNKRLVLLDGLTHYWPLTEESDGSTKVDRLDIIGTADFVEVGGNIPSDTGKVLTSIRMQDDYTHWLQSDQTLLDLSGETDWSFSFWTKVAEININGGNYFAINDTSNTLTLPFGISLWDNGTTEITVDLSFNDHNKFVRKEHLPINILEWNFVTATYNHRTNEASVYINSELLATDSAEPVTSDFPWCLGGDYNYGTPGWYEELLIWNRTLNQEDVNLLYFDGTGIDLSELF